MDADLPGRMRRSNLKKIGGTNSPASVGARPSSDRICRWVNPPGGIASLMSMAAVALCAPQQTQAAQVIATVTGTVQSGTAEPECLASRQTLRWPDKILHWSI